MTEIEQKAQALIAPGAACEVNFENISILARAFTSAIEQHEAFRQELSDFKQEVSDAATAYAADQPYIWKHSASGYFSRFIIPAPKPDPLVDALQEVDICSYAEIKAEYADCLRADLVNRIRAALDAFGLQIVEKSK